MVGTAFKGEAQRNCTAFGRGMEMGEGALKCVTWSTCEGQAEETNQRTGQQERGLRGGRVGGPGLCSAESKHHAWGVKASGRQLAQLAADQSGVT